MIVVVVVSSIGRSINRSADSIISSCNREAGFHLVRQTNIGILNKHCLLLHLGGGDDDDEDDDAVNGDDNLVDDQGT